MHIYRDISELGHITVSELQVSTYTTYDIREKHCKIDGIMGNKIKPFSGKYCSLFYFNYGKE